MSRRGKCQQKPLDVRAVNYWSDWLKSSVSKFPNLAWQHFNFTFAKIWAQYGKKKTSSAAAILNVSVKNNSPWIWCVSTARPLPCDWSSQNALEMLSLWSSTRLALEKVKLLDEQTSHTVVYLSEVLKNAKEVGLQLHFILVINLQIIFYN